MQNGDDQLKDLRDSIRDIDTQMAALFEKRMALSKLVAQRKLKANLSIYDEKRENENIEAISQLIQKASEKPLFIRWYKMLMDISKKVQEEWIRRHE